MKLKDRVAIVTGGAIGIGRGVVLSMAEEGANAVVADIDFPGAQETARQAEALGPEAMALKVDVTSDEDVRRMVHETLKRFGKIDILVNNAGVVGGKNLKLGMPLWDLTEEDWELAFQVNMKGAFLVTRAVLPHMMERRYGKIINMSSRAGRDGRESIPNYSTTKAALINFTQALAKEGAPHNINVNAICPGMIFTPIWESLAALYQAKYPHLKGMSPREVFDHFLQATTPLKREQTPEDIGRAAVFLASEDARNITGQALLVDGGAVMF